MAHKLLVVMILGLGTLWVLHLLAQDYNKIRRPVQAATKLLRFLGRRKRDTSSTVEGNSEQDREEKNELSVNWDFLMKFDPLECAQSLICQLATGENTFEDNSEASNIKKFIEHSVQGSEVPKRISKAYKMGKFKGKNSECQEVYFLCPYSAKTMLNIIELQSRLLG